jgi:cytochrome c553
MDPNLKRLSPRPIRYRFMAWAMVFCLLAVVPASKAPAQSRTGEQIYRQMCARCHGPKGEGTKDHHPEPLTGNRSMAQLARYIAKSMPEDAPGTCSGPDAEKVARYIFDSFYSPAAQARNKPPRVELARLTVRQYQNTVADLAGSFRPRPSSPAGKQAEQEKKQQGLRGEYYQSRGGRFRKSKPAFTRIDRVVRFDFGIASPDPAKLKPEEFSIRWEGSLLAPDTGIYDFVVRTENSARLWLNDLKKPLIDAMVKSGNDTEYKASIFLLGGRLYPVRLEFAKAKLGVQMKKKGKQPAIKASIALEWKRPHRAQEVVPDRHLSPQQSAEVLVVTTPFPPDDRSLGYERATTISRAWVQATTDAAIEVASHVAGHIPELSGVRDDAPDRKARVRDFCMRFVERAFRRPLTEAQKQLYVEHQFAAARDVETAVKRVVLLTVKSPRFLYRELDAAPAAGDAFDVAARLSFGLWDSLPSEQLIKAGADGRLATRMDVTQQAGGMMADERTRAKLRDFFLQWLKVDPVPDLMRDTKNFPGFDQAAASDLRTSLELFLDDVVWSEASDFRRLFLTNELYLNGRLGKIYGANLPADAPFQKVAFKPGQRAGVLTHPYLMATFAYPKTSSPIHRGVFLARNVLGVTLRPPPEAFAPLAPELRPELTTRERVALQTNPRACQSCHAVINPLGFTLENFDAIGRFRDREKNRPIDASGSYQTRTGKLVHFAGVQDLARFLADSDDVHEAFVTRLFHYLVKQPVAAYGSQKLSELKRVFADNHYNIRRLVVAIVAESALPAGTTKPGHSGQPAGASTR